MFDKDRLISAREAAGITKAELADRSGLSVSAIQGYETGRRRPNADQLGRLAKALGVSADYLLCLVDEEANQLFQAIKASPPEVVSAVLTLVSRR